MAEHSAVKPLLPYPLPPEPPPGTHAAMMEGPPHQPHGPQRMVGLIAYPTGRFYPYAPGLGLIPDGPETVFTPVYMDDED